MKPNETTEWIDCGVFTEIRTKETSRHRARKHIFDTFQVLEVAPDMVGAGPNTIFIPYRDGKMVGVCGFTDIYAAIGGVLDGAVPSGDALPR